MDGTAAGTPAGTETAAGAGTGNGATPKETAGDAAVFQGRDALYIGGRWRPAAGHERIEVVDPVTEQV
ncbi:MAG: hypothetical protein QOF98_2250, partial [Streptomyces sp.]|nr:hypothetical protein [Streptomyces sp.]